jgi:hypothetical protein
VCDTYDRVHGEGKGAIEDEIRNAEFIAHAPEDIDALLAENARLTAERDAQLAAARRASDRRAWQVKERARAVAHSTDDAHVIRRLLTELGTDERSQPDPAAQRDALARGVWKRLDPRLRWAVGEDGNPRAWTLWSFALATMGWSAGDGGCARHVNDHADALAAIEEPLRWGAFCRLASVEDDAGRKHKQDEYSALRTAQKLAAAGLAAEFTGEWAMARAWLDDGLGAERGAVYARLVEVST